MSSLRWLAFGKALLVRYTVQIAVSSHKMADNLGSQIRGGICLLPASSWVSVSVLSRLQHVSIRATLYIRISDIDNAEAIFAAECSPPKLRGALTMQWQMWTAFGIMFGYVADLAFYFVSVFSRDHNPSSGPIYNRLIYVLCTLRTMTLTKPSGS